MFMKDRKIEIRHIIIATIGIIIGILLICYGFALVSVPEVKEYKESRYVFAALAICIGSIIYGFIQRQRYLYPDE